MARFNEILVGRVNRSLQKLFGMKGGPPAPQLATEVQPVHSLFSGVENRVLESWERFSITLGPTGGAGQQAAVRLRNPAGSNLIAVIEKVTLASGASQNVAMQIQQTGVDLTTLAVMTGARLDARSRPTPSAIMSSTTNYVSASRINWESQFPANSGVDEILDNDQELTLLPGDDMTWFSGVVAVQLLVSVMWRERFLEDSERA
jgi:hypothetical protein